MKNNLCATLFAALVLGPSACNVSEPEALRPNIIFILTDDMNFRELSCYGQEHYKTPNLDQLAKVGVRFTQAYVGGCACSQSRGTLMTSLHTGHGPIRDNGSARGQEPLPDSCITIAEVLKEAGYATCLSGKWGLGEKSNEGPHAQGFDVGFGINGQVRAHTYFPDYMDFNGEKIPYPQNSGFDMGKVYKKNRGNPENTYDENGALVLAELTDPHGWAYSEKEFENTALKFIRDNRDHPFFLYFPTQLPHGPNIVDNLGEMQFRTDIPLTVREHAAMTIRLDKFVGELVHELKSLGIYKNTIIFFASDNGVGGRNSVFSTHGPFTGGKNSVQEGGIRVPFFVSWEGMITPKVVSQPVWTLDFFPTAANLAGASYSHPVDGTDLWPLLGGDPGIFNPKPYMYWNVRREQSVRLGAWFGWRKTPEDPLLLYLPEEDTYGVHNLASSYPEIARQIETIMDTAYTPHPWYWLPNENEADWEIKKARAIKEGLVIPLLMPNGMDAEDPSSPFYKIQEMDYLKKR